MKTRVIGADARDEAAAPDVVSTDPTSTDAADTAPTSTDAADTDRTGTDAADGDGARGGDAGCRGARSRLANGGAALRRTGATLRRSARARLIGESVLVALLVAAVVVVATLFAGEEHQARVSLLAGPAGPELPQYGEVVALSLPALVELARSPSVVGKAGTKAERVSVELVPASGLARLSVRAPSAAQADNEVAAVAKAVVEADLLAPAGKLRQLDRPQVTRVAPDWPLTTGMALAAAVVAGIAAAAVRHLRRTRIADGVRAALASAGVAHPVALLPDDDPRLVERLAVLCGAARRPVRVVAVVPDLAARAEALAEALPDQASEAADGVAMVAVAPRTGARDELAGVVGARPADAAVVAVVLA